MRRLHINAAVAIILACGVAAADYRVKDKGIAEVLSRFPGYHLLTLQDRDSETRAFLLKHFPKDSASVVRADFDGDGLEDYAVLIKADKSATTKLVVVLCSENIHYRPVYSLDLTTDSESVYIRPLQVGSKVSGTPAIEGDHNSLVRLKTAGIQLTYFEQAKVVLYWNKSHKKMETLQTAD
jgi:hypothetical protein